MSVLYDRIHALCDAKGVKDGTMCRESGVARSTFQELKMGRTESLSLKNLHKIADYFGVSISELTGEEQKEKPAPSEGSGLDARFDALLSQMTDADRADLLEYMEFKVAKRKENPNG